MSLAHLDDPSTRNIALVSGRQRLAIVREPRIAQRLREQLERDPDMMLRGLVGDEEGYLEWMVELMQNMAGAAFTLIGELTGEDWDRVRTIELRTPGGRGENFEYDLLHTPCANVVGQSACVYPNRVAELFPHDDLLAQMGVECYVGMPFFDPGGRPLGLMIMLDNKPWSEPVMTEVLALMLEFRPRLEQLLINRRTRRDMLLLSGGPDAEGGDSLARLVRSFAHAMNVRAAFVCSGDAQTCALVIDGKPAESRELWLDPALLAQVSARGELLLREGDREWPALAERAPLPARACLLLSLAAPDGAPLGHLVLLHDRLLNQQIGRQPVVQAFRRQIAFELHRTRVEAERVATTQRLLELQRTESLGLLAGGIAHDFNNLLVGVLGNVELALAELPEPSDACREALTDVRGAAEAATQLCRQLLAYAGRTRIELQQVDLDHEVDEIARLLAASIPRTIELLVTHDEAAHWVDGDLVQLRQMLMNLVTNAADAIGEAPGHIEIALTHVELAAGERQGIGGELPAGRHVCVRVRDDGCGMDEATRTRIFDPFFTTKAQGHGLGLAAMLGIVRSHGGGLTVDSTRNVGTEFCVYLPSSGAAIEQPTRERVSTRVFGRR